MSERRDKKKDDNKHFLLRKLLPARLKNLTIARRKNKEASVKELQFLCLIALIHDLLNLNKSESSPVTGTENYTEIASLLAGGLVSCM